MKTRAIGGRAAVRELVLAVKAIPAWRYEPDGALLDELLHDAPEVALLDRLDDVVRTSMGGMISIAPLDERIYDAVRRRAQAVRFERRRLLRLAAAADAGHRFTDLLADPLLRSSTCAALLDLLTRDDAPAAPATPRRAEVTWSGIYLDSRDQPTIDLFRDGARVLTLRGARVVDVFCAVADARGGLVPWSSFVRENPRDESLDGLARLSRLVRRTDAFRTSGNRIRRLVRQAFDPAELDWQHPRGQAGARLVRAS